MNDNELKQVYITLGLPDTASKEEIENRYFLLLKKQRSLQNRTGSTRETNGMDSEAVNKAFRQIMQHHKEQASLEYEEKNYSQFYKKWNLEKIDYFWDYYKIHVIVGIVLLVFIIAGIHTFIEKKAEREALEKLPPPDLTLMFYGDFYTENEEGMDRKLLDQVPGWERVVLKFTPFPQEATNQMDIALQQKAILSLMTEKPDMYIVDRANFESLSRQNAFLNLNEWLGPVSSRLDTKVIQRFQGNDDIQPEPYGVDVGGSTLFDELQILGKEIIVALRYDGHNIEAARQFVNLLLETTP